MFSDLKGTGLYWTQYTIIVRNHHSDITQFWLHSGSCPEAMWRFLIVWYYVVASNGSTTPVLSRLESPHRLPFSRRPHERFYFADFSGSGHLSSRAHSASSRAQTTGTFLLCLSHRAQSSRFPTRWSLLQMKRNKAVRWGFGQPHHCEAVSHHSSFHDGVHIGFKRHIRSFIHL